MSIVNPMDTPPGRGEWPVMRRLSALALVVLVAVAVPVLPQGPERLAVWAVTLTLAFLFLLVDAVGLMRRWLQRRIVERLHALVAEDATPCIATDDLGRVLHRNRAAVARFGSGEAPTLAAALGDVFAHPSAMLYRLQGRAARATHAREDVVTRRGCVRVSVHQGAPGHFLWRFEEFADRGPVARGADGVSLPMLVAGRGGVVLFANEAMRRLLGARPRALDRVFTQLPVQSGATVAVTGAEGPVEALVVEIEGVADRREIYLLPSSVVPRAPAIDGVDELPVALVRLAPNGNVISVNRTGCELLGIGPETRVNASDLFEGLGRPLRDWIGDVAAGRLPGKAEVLRLSGTETFVQIALRALGPGPQDGLIAVISDATALKTLEAQFVQSQKMQAIGQLAGGVAHDFNNLLTAISGHCDLLLLHHDPTDPDYADLAQIHQNANRAADLVGQLLAFSRKQTLRPARLHLDEVLDDVTHLLKRLVGERVRLELVHHEGLGTIRADRRQLEQVLINLVVNARDAMPEGGTIRIETEPCLLDQPRTLGRAELPAGNYAVVRVVDQGCGIPPEQVEKVFEPFFTTKRPGEGTGLGLSTAYGIVKQSGGYIFVDSEPGRGACFSLYFPLHGGPVEEPLPPAAPAAAPRIGQGGVVLLVEDEAPVRAFAARALGMRGFTVIEADCGEAALQVLADPALAVDVFVTDVIMPGMDGPTWVRQALRDRPSARVIFVSGYAEDGFAGAQDDIPGSTFLPKPFSLQDLSRAVQEQFGQTGPVPGSGRV